MALAVVALIFGIGAITQVFLVGLSLFESAEYWTNHVDLGRMLGPLALLLPVFALLGRVDRRIFGRAALVTVLYILQFALANIDVGFIAAFHALNAFALIGMSMSLGVSVLGGVRDNKHE